METFIYCDLNRACREKKINQIQYYGAFAAALSYIIYKANSERGTNNLSSKNTFYRGLKLDRDEIDLYTVGSIVNLTGYTSSSKKKDNALKFTLFNDSNDKIPVLFQIDFKGDRGLFEMSYGFSAYPGEDEVLIQDGLEYRIMENYE